MKKLGDKLFKSGFFSTELSSIIENQFQSKTFEKNEFLLKENEVSDAYYFIESGIIRSFAIDTDGNEISTQFYTEGDMVFEVQSFFLRCPSKENFQALTQIDCKWISFETMNKLFHEYPQFREFGRSMLVQGFANLKGRMLSHITTTAEERYQQLILDKPFLIEQVPLKYLSSYLGITDTSLSRIRKEMSK